MVPEKYHNQTCVIIATGPSLSKDQISTIETAHSLNRCKVITVNNAYQLAPFTDAHISYNENWWEYYMAENDLILLRDRGCEMWTKQKNVATSFDINFIKTKPGGKHGNGLSKDRTLIHENHGSGPMAMNLATLYGFKKILLVGHDMKYPKDYDGRKKITGGKRHFFGEYPKSMQHWASTRVGKHTNGVMEGYCEYYTSMVSDLEKLNVKVINCTPESALQCFKMGNLKDELE